MSINTTFILFGTAGQNVAQGDGRFGRTLRKAFGAFYGTKEAASEKLMGFCEEESDNYAYNEFGTKVQYMVSCDEESNTIEWETIMDQGDMSYDHDSRTWEYIAIGDLNEKDAAIVIRDGVLSDTELEEVYALHPDLRPEEEVEEDEA